MLFYDSRWQCFAWLVNLTVVAAYSLFPYFSCSLVDSIQFYVACCTAVSCSWRYIRNISLVQLLPLSGPKCRPSNTHTHTICVLCGGVLFFHHLQNTSTSFTDMMVCIIPYWIIMCLCNTCIHTILLSCSY